MAFLSLALLVPAGLAAESTSAKDSGNASNWRAEADQMVSAHAAIDRTLDAKNAKDGEQFEARMPNKVHLKDGTELPSGTVLIGKVVQDDLNESGKSKLALCIDEAKLKDGKTIPLKATIVGVYGPGAGASYAYPVAPGDQVSAGWTPSTDQVDELNALSGVDLHSRIGSNSSGVLVSTKKDDIKLKPGTELALAIAGEGIRD